MIMPDMATMLSFIFTDAAVAPDMLQRMLKTAVERSFNCISVDADTSTNDTVYLLANGASGRRIETDRQAAFQQALDEVALSLALAVVRDGEGARKLVRIDIEGAANDRDAKKIAVSDRQFAPGENRNRRRRSQLGAHSSRRGQVRRGVRSGAGRYLNQRNPGLRKGPARRVRRSGRSTNDGGGRIGDPFPYPRRGRGQGAFLDLRLHRRVHSHQRRVPHLSCFPCRRSAFSAGAGALA